MTHRLRKECSDIQIEQIFKIFYWVNCACNKCNQRPLWESQTNRFVILLPVNLSVSLCVHSVVRPVRTPSSLRLSVCRTESTTGTPNPSASSAPAAPSALWASASWPCRACCCAPWSARRRLWPPEGTSRIIFWKSASSTPSQFLPNAVHVISAIILFWQINVFVWLILMLFQVLVFGK